MRSWGIPWAGPCPMLTPNHPIPGKNLRTHLDIVGGEDPELSVWWPTSTTSYISTEWLASCISSSSFPSSVMTAGSSVLVLAATSILRPKRSYKTETSKGSYVQYSCTAALTYFIDDALTITSSINNASTTWTLDFNASPERPIFSNAMFLSTLSIKIKTRAATCHVDLVHVF